MTVLTDSLPEELRETPFVSGSPVWFTSWDHLAEVPGILVEPDEPNGAAVVIVHGGPTWHHSNEWDPLRQAFVAAGLTVLHPNYRGSDGYGRRWQLANRWLMGQGEVLDVAAAHEFLVRHGCDPARIAITGRSWGGFHTMAAVTQFPDLWAAGVAGVPFFDFIDSQLDPTIREDLRWWDRENTGDIERDRAQAAVLLAHQPPRRCGGAAPAPRRRPRPPLPAAADRRGRGDAARARPRLRLRRLPGRGPRDQRPRAPRSTTTGARSTSSSSTRAAPEPPAGARPRAGRLRQRCEIR